MSFTNTVKNELVELPLNKIELTSVLSGFLKNSISSERNLKITTENAVIARFIFKTIKENYDVYIKVSVKKGYNYNKNYIYNLDIADKKNIVNDLCLDKTIPEDYLLDDDDLKRSYLRGVFMGCGSINDPKTSQYHMEFVFENINYALFINNLLNDYNLNSKYLKRDNKYMVYIKESEKISDFLRVIKATRALLYYENIRVYRSQKNNLNRINNCEQANVDKIIQTAKNQVDDINYIKDKDMFDLLDDKLKEACVYRLKYSEVSLLELSKIMTLETGVPITKSGLYHRFNKLKKMVSILKEKDNVE